ncbi:hypothetical protein tb265_49520 [Gemmatimonadetes bacterium T265]|nr:hypothetical protein tb265_49520 [Gemmatimonadetes bacterium T265]
MHQHQRWRARVAGFLLAGSAQATHAAQPATGCADLRPAIRAAAGVLARRYVIPEDGRDGADALLDGARRGRDARVCGGAEAQAARLTQRLRAAVPDWHLRVAPGVPPPKSPPADVPAGLDADADDHGIVEVSRLAGGIGYLRLAQFDDVRTTEPRLAHAMALLAGVRGVILDVRGNRGGDGATMDLVLRSFLPADAPATLLTLDRSGAVVARPALDPRWARFAPATPVVVLVDRASASAAEALAFGLREEGRATVVGERSLGAAHVVDDAVGLPGDFALFIPEFRVVGRKTRRDWERGGVVPDVEAHGADALLLAWEQLRARGRTTHDVAR